MWAPQACCTAQQVGAGKDLGNQDTEPRRKPIPTQGQVPCTRRAQPTGFLGWDLEPSTSRTPAEGSLPSSGWQMISEVLVHTLQSKYRCYRSPHTSLLTDTPCPSPCALTQSPRVLPQTQATKKPLPLGSKYGQPDEVTQAKKSRAKRMGRDQKASITPRTGTSTSVS